MKVMEPVSVFKRFQLGKCKWKWNERISDNLGLYPATMDRTKLCTPGEKTAPVLSSGLWK